ncbi:MAG: hypothetical protein ACLFWM_05130 [Actinomycetota bacterium]
MKPLVSWALVVIVSAVPSPATAQGETEAADAAELLADPAEWDGRRVAVTGELVGDYSAREEGVWVQVNDDAFAETPVPAGGDPASANQGLGALVPTGQFSPVEGAPGGYARRGPLVRLTGEFVHSDPHRQGETYLRVVELTLLRPGSDIPVPGPDAWMGIGVVLILAAGLITRVGRRSSDS